MGSILTRTFQYQWNCFFFWITVKINSQTMITYTTATLWHFRKGLKCNLYLYRQPSDFSHMSFLKSVEVKLKCFMAIPEPLQCQLSHPNELEQVRIQRGTAHVTLFLVQVAVDGCVQVLLKNTNIHLVHYLINVHILQTVKVQHLPVCAELELWRCIHVGEFNSCDGRHFFVFWVTLVRMWKLTFGNISSRVYKLRYSIIYSTIISSITYYNLYL